MKEINLLGIFLEAEEIEEEISMILDSSIAYDLAIELKDDFGKEIFSEGTYHYDFEYLKDTYDILTLTVTFKEDKTPLYFLEETLLDDDTTIYTEADTFYIQEELIDIINIDRLNGDIYTMEVYEDLEHCYDEELEEDEYDDEITVEDELEELLQDTLEDIENGECDCDKCIYEKIMDMLLSAYYMGVEDTE